MRIIYDINCPMIVSGGGRPYGNAPGIQGFNHAQVNLLICEDLAVNHPELPPEIFTSKNAIYIEGDSTHITKALEDALNVLYGLQECMRDKMGESRPTNCPDGCSDIEKSNGNHEITCPRHPNYEHFWKSR